ncbi:hypothetical protein [Bartonella refiksaydamii]|uniref:hypothetical protein n=1 Tax=Bartonella refiksaydamii TaxID=2654951 RepID=UPI001FEF2DEE|nr:hypothetical protein [Bartonella refiksaydamii]
MFEPKNNKERGIFSTYGNRCLLFSSSKPSQDGANADIRYAALQTDLTLIALEDQNVSTDFVFWGHMGN